MKKQVVYVRLPEDLRADLKTVASENGISMNAASVLFIKAGLKASKTDGVSLPS